MSLTYPAECVGTAGGSVLASRTEIPFTTSGARLCTGQERVVGTLRPRVMSGHRFARIRRSTVRRATRCPAG